MRGKSLKNFSRYARNFFGPPPLDDPGVGQIPKIAGAARPPRASGTARGRPRPARRGGGGLTIATAVALRDRRTVRPDRLAVLSPWTDLTCSGDSYRTLVHADPTFDDPAIPPALAAAYAGDRTTDPLASPLFADHHDLRLLARHRRGANPSGVLSCLAFARRRLLPALPVRWEGTATMRSSRGSARLTST